MVCRELPVEEMLPRISLCRFFETINAPPKNSLDRIAECYELSFYMALFILTEPITRCITEISGSADREPI